MQDVQLQIIDKHIRRAREEERLHIARDLHDRVVQTLAGLNYQVASLREQSTQPVAEQLLCVQDDLRFLIEEIRAICADLRPPILDTRGLFATIQAAAAYTRDHANLRVTVQIQGSQNQHLPEDVTGCLVRVFQEALANIQKHAEASHIVISLLLDAQAVSLVVQDDGKGFDVPASFHQLRQQRHFGLLGMKERLALVGGTLTLDSRAGHGVRLCAMIDLTTQCPNNLMRGGTQ